MPMFPWGLARSAESVFSRWAIRHVCKFLLKRKFGKFIQGDLDLDQLDVQLGAGTIQLNDLALNVDYLNHKLGMPLVIVKEGSIGSLLVKIPWKVRSCEIEVEELEIVLAPCKNNLPAGTQASMPDQDSKPSASSCGSDNFDCEMAHGDTGSVCLDVHEGVKTIAKMVKWLLSSFHVKIKNLIVAFDPCLGRDGEKSQSQRTLVLRITETEYGTCISEDTGTHSDLRGDSFLGMNRLTNFVKFQGATVELLQMVDPAQPSSASGTAFTEGYVGSLPSTTPISIVAGEGGAFSGTLKLSIPWKNGSLDIRKVDADLSVDSMELILSPSIVKWIICLWDSLTVYKAPGSQCPDSPSHCNSVSIGSAAVDADGLTKISENSLVNLCSQSSRGTASGILLPGTHLIPDWVPLCTSKKQDGGEKEPDYGASIDQFFECFDEMRSSQTTLGGSGMWNWTCSVFSAITAASSLASGSVHIPPEQKHMETNLRATFASIAVVLSFNDKDQKYPSDKESHEGNSRDLSGIKQKSYSSGNAIMPLPYAVTAGSIIHAPSYPVNPVEQSDSTELDYAAELLHYLEAKVQNLVLVLQIGPQEVKLEAIIKHVEVDDYSDGDAAMGFSFSDCESSLYCKMLLVQRLQAEVQAALPPLPTSFQDPDPEETENMFSSGDAPLYVESVNDKVPANNPINVNKGKLVKVKLFKTSGETACHCAVSSAYTEDKSKPSTSFSVKLPPFIMWVNFYLVNMLLDLSRQVVDSLGTSNTNKDSESEGKDFGKEHGSSCQEGNSIVHSPKGSLEGSIFLPLARVIFCFPLQAHGTFRSFSPEDDFIGVDFFPALSVEKVVEASQVRDVSYKDEYSYMPSGSIHLNIGNFNFYLISSLCKDAAGSKLCAIDKWTFSSQKVISVTRGSDDDCSGISVLWQVGPVTGPWIAQRAWGMATSKDSRSARNKVSGKGYEFASVTTAEDLDGTNSRVRQEMILSSTFFLHIRLSLVWVKLGSSEYRLIHRLLNRVFDGFSCEAYSDKPADPNECLKGGNSSPSDVNISQSSILIECDVLDVSISSDEVLNINRSLQKELPGSWDILRLKIEKFEMLSVSNIGGISSARFLWVSHDEGTLWGSIAGTGEEAPMAGQDFLLICAKNSAMHRGDGEGANVLSSGSAGSAIMHLWYPHLSQSATSITVRCGTIIAPGGRLDWLSLISSFFSLTSDDSKQLGNSDAQKNCSEDDAVYETLFSLQLVDVALSYEPHIKNLNINRAGSLESDCRNSAKPVEEFGDQYVACLLAAASLSLSNWAVENSASNKYIIRLHDVGFLCALSVAETGRHGYGVEYLRRNGYVKVVGETLVEAVLRTGCPDGPLWELEVSDCHFGLDTCHDTTAGLIRLAAQLQDLFAPDIEESVVHLQTRWDSVRQASDGHDVNTMTGIFDKATSPLASCTEALNHDQGGRTLVAGLMDEVVEDAFFLGVNSTGFSKSRGANSHVSLDGDISDFSNSSSSVDVLPLNFTFSRSMSGLGLEGIQTSPSPLKSCFPEIVEDHFLSCQLPLSSSSIRNNTLDEETLTLKTNREAHEDIESGRWYEESSLRILENHISSVSDHQPEGREPQGENGFPASINSALPGEFHKAKGRIRLKNIDVRWRMYGGSDWSHLRKNVPLVSDACGRDVTACLELALSGMNIQYDMFPDGEICVSQLLLSVQDFHIYDCSRDAPWKKVLGYYHSRDHPRESRAKAFRVNIEAVRPDPLTPLEEYRLQLALLPLRLHLDQGQLNFLTSFFAKKGSVVQPPSLPGDPGRPSMLAAKDSSFRGQTIVEEALLPFFQKCDIWPVVVRVDYIPHHIDLAALRGGNYAELLNLVPWKGIELQLKHVHAVGIYGWSNVCEAIVGEWLVDISHNQVPKLLKGLAPLRSFLAVGSGTAKLVSLPVKNYKKDHKLVKGMQRGAIAFLRSISLEAVGLGLHLAAGAHDILLQTEYILANIPPSLPSPLRSRAETNVRSNQPKDAQQGIQQAYESLSHGLERTASALVGNPLKTYQRGAGVGSALASAVRAAPAAAMAPVSSAACAVHCALLGVRNSLNPDLKKESMEKYSGST